MNRRSLHDWQDAFDDTPHHWGDQEEMTRTEWMARIGVGILVISVPTILALGGCFNKNRKERYKFKDSIDLNDGTKPKDQEVTPPPKKPEPAPTPGTPPPYSPTVYS